VSGWSVSIRSSGGITRRRKIHRGGGEKIGKSRGNSIERKRDLQKGMIVVDWGMNGWKGDQHSISTFRQNRKRNKKLKRGRKDVVEKGAESSKNIEVERPNFHSWISITPLSSKTCKEKKLQIFKGNLRKSL